MWNHLPEMAAQMRELGIERPDLSPREMGDLIAFLYWLDYFDPSGDVERGKQLFSEKRCVLCHQVGGVGGVAGPNLDFLRQYGSPIQIATAMWNHGSAMTEAMRSKGITRPTFTGPDLVALLAYIGSSSPEPPAGPLYVLPGRADAGQRVFVEKKCVECHGVRGQAGGVGPDLAEASRGRSLIEFAAAMWNKAPEMTKAMKARGISIPELRAAEMADLVAYLYSIRYFDQSGDLEKGRRHVREKGCLSCHSLSGGGGASASDLGQTKGLVTSVAVVAALWNHTLAGGDRPEGQAVPWPTLQPSEIADLAVFLQSSGLQSSGRGH
jgi:mono/diheme cytochrome c family protein